VTRVDPKTRFVVRHSLSACVEACPGEHFQPRSGARRKPTAQAVGRGGTRVSPIGAKDLFSKASILIMLAVALLSDASCNRQPTKPAALFPASNEVAGWVKSGDIRTFEAADLWKYIDGEAERYLKAGVQRVFTADYRYQNKVDAVVDIYAMGRAEGARRIFDSEPAGDANPVRLGNGAHLYGQSLVIRKGLYLVRIVAYQESAETPQAIVELGRNIEWRLTK